MITKVPDPLLCITVSTTLRHKPLPVTAPRRTLAALIDAAGGLKSGNGLTSPARANGATEDHTFESDDDEVLSGLQEVNLLEGLASGESSVVWIAFDADGFLQVPPSMTLQGDSRCPPSDWEQIPACTSSLWALLPLRQLQKLRLRFRAALPHHHLVATSLAQPLCASRSARH